MDIELNGEVPNHPNEPDGLLNASNPSNQEGKSGIKNSMIMLTSVSLTL
jgi:hypothetical protein